MCFSVVPRALWFVMALVLVSACDSTDRQAVNAEIELTQAQAEAIFDYAYPLVIMRVSQDLMMTVPFRDKTVPNHFIHLNELARPDQRAVVLGNRNTLYSVGWLDLSAGPVLFEIPDMGDRYYVMPLLDAWTNTFASLGSRTTGQKAQKYFLANQSWEGSVPEGYTLQRSPTNMVWITGRIQADNAADATLAAELQQQYRLITFAESNGGKDPFADYQPKFKAIWVRKPVPYTLKMSAEDFYDTFLEMWANNASPAADSEFVALLAQAGMVAGNTAEFAQLPSAIQKMLERGLEAKQEHYTQAFYSGSEQKEPWIFNLDPDMGDWATDYPRRAYWAMWGLGTNISKDAVYGVTQLDSEMAALDGKHSYHIHFAADDTPPNDAFWSVTAYDIEGYLEENELDRYSLGSNHELKFNADGSLDFYLNHEAPSADKVNWVPVPEGEFKILLRIYRPGDEVLAGKWALPDINRLAE